LYGSVTPREQIGRRIVRIPGTQYVHIEGISQRFENITNFPSLQDIMYRHKTCIRNPPCEAAKVWGERVLFAVKLHSLHLLHINSLNYSKAFENLLRRELI
jgi:hypothetical protein